MTRGDREKRYQAEIDGARSALAAQKEMWLGLVKDSESQIKELEEQITKTDADTERLGADYERRQSAFDAAEEDLANEVVLAKLRAAEIASEVDLLEHHHGLISKLGSPSRR